MNDVALNKQSQLSLHWQWARERMAAASNIVDLGCGPYPIEQANTGVDFFLKPEQRGCGTGAQINVANLERNGFRFVNTRLDGPLPFIDKEFDFAYSNHVFEHLEFPEIACQETMRIAEAGVIITPSIFADIAFGRSYHRWLMIAGENTLFFFEKLPEEDRPFGNHPNPFDILLDYGGWVTQDLDSNSTQLRGLLQANWDSRSSVIEVVFPWTGSFNFQVERRRKSSISLPLQIPAPASSSTPAKSAEAKKNIAKPDERDQLQISKILAESDLSDDALRCSPELIARLNAAGMPESNLDSYWTKLQFIGNATWGSALEIGAGCGDITRFIVTHSKVSRVVAVDTNPEYIEALKLLKLPAVEAHRSFDLEAIPVGNYDSIVIANLIEHMDLMEELSMLSAIKTSLEIGANFIVAVAKGNTSNANQRRKFSRTQFTDHLQKHYGSILRLASDDTQHLAIITYLGEYH